MKLPTNSSRAFAVIAIAVSVFGLVMSPVSASAAFSPGDNAGIPAGNFAGHHALNSTQAATRLQAVLANLSQNGVDVSPAQADLASGNTTAAARWVMAYHKDHQETSLNGTRQNMFNSTRHADHRQNFLTNPGQDGVDVSQALADLATGNISGTMTALMALHKDHPRMMGNDTKMVPHGERPGMKENATQQAARLQAVVSGLAGQGVDVGEVSADLASGDTSAAMQWIAEYRTSHPANPANMTARRDGNVTGWNDGSFRQHPVGFRNGTAGHPGFPARMQGP